MKAFFSDNYTIPKHKTVNPLNLKKKSCAYLALILTEALDFLVKCIDLELLLLVLLNLTIQALLQVLQQHKHTRTHIRNLLKRHKR